jgi:hypothetical protein
MRIMTRNDYLAARSVKSLVASDVRDDGLMTSSGFKGRVTTQYTGRALLISGDVYALIEPGDVVVYIAPGMGILTPQEVEKLAVLQLLENRSVLPGFGAKVHNEVYLISGK